MDSIVDPKDFPASYKCTYLNAANVALMYQGAEKAIIEWQKDLGENGSKTYGGSSYGFMEKGFCQVFSPPLQPTS